MVLCFFTTNKILTVHNLVVHQALNLMHKIFIGVAPASILALFNLNTEIALPVNISTINLSSLLRQGINPDNILAQPLERIHKQFFIKQEDPLNFYAQRIYGHYSAEGYNKIAKIIIENIKK